MLMDHGLTERLASDIVLDDAYRRSARGGNITRIGQYIRRWIQWAVAGLKNLITSNEAWRGVYEFYNTSSSSGHSRHDPFVPPKFVCLLAPTTVSRPVDVVVDAVRGASDRVPQATRRSDIPL